MPFHLALIPFLVLPSQIQPGQPTDAQQLKLPFPLSKAVPNSGLLVCGGSHLGVGCDFQEGSSFRGMEYCLPFWESDESKHCVFVGQSAGLISEWYLGHGAIVNFKCGLPQLQSSIGIDYYPVGNLIFSLRFDLLKGQLQFAWQFENFEDPLFVLGIAYTSYWLATQALPRAFDE